MVEHTPRTAPTSESNALMEPPSSMRPAARISTATTCPSFPAEIWRTVFSVGYYDEDGGFWSDYESADLASICRSCTAFRDLVRPVLYNFFNSHPYIPYQCDLNKRYHFSIVKFARTISTNPLLASMVRRVWIERVCDAWDVVSEAPVPFGYYPDDPLASVLTKRAVELGMVLRYYEVYTKVHSPENVGFDLVALTLAQLPNLDSLNIKWSGKPPVAQMPQPREGWTWNQNIRDITLHYSDPTQHHLSHGQRSRSPGDSFSPVLPLFCCGTRLTRLTLFDSTGPKSPLPLDNLREAIVLECQFRPGQFLNLLKSCKSLIKFVVRNADLSCGLEIIQALEPACSGLEALGLDFDSDYGGRISSLRQFTALKTLYLDMPCVWDTRGGGPQYSPPYPDMLLMTLLPESVEEVVLFSKGVGNSCGFELEAHVRRLALERAVHGRIQHLRSLHGVLFSSIDEEMESDMEQAMDDNDPDEVREIYNRVERRHTTLDEARELMDAGGIEFTFDFDKEKDSYLCIDHLTWGPDI